MSIFCSVVPHIQLQAKYPYAQRREVGCYGLGSGNVVRTVLCQQLAEFDNSTHNSAAGSI